MTFERQVHAEDTITIVNQSYKFIPKSFINVHCGGLHNAFLFKKSQCKSFSKMKLRSACNPNYYYHEHSTDI